MSKENRPAFLFYASDWFSGTCEMTYDEKGLFIDMLAQSWLRFGLPTDIERLVIMFGGEANRKRIAHVLLKFRIAKIDNREVYVNDKLERIRDQERTKFENRSAANSKNALKRGKKADNDPELLLDDNERIANESQAKIQRKEDEDIDEYEIENRTETIGGAGGKSEPRKSFAHHLENFISAYGGIKGGNRRAIEVAYIDAVNTLNSEGHSDFAAHELLAIQAARDREYCKQASQTRNNTQNWLAKRLWEKDYDQELKMYLETQESKSKGKDNGHGREKPESLATKAAKFTRSHDI